MEVIFCVELWVTNNHNVLRELSCPLIACAVPATKVTRELPARRAKPCTVPQPCHTQIAKCNSYYFAVLQVWQGVCSSLLCCQCLLLASAFQSNLALIKNEDCRRLYSREVTDQNA